MNTSNIRYLHVIRGLAALLVVIFHSKFVLWVGGNTYSATVGLHSVWDYLLFSIDMLSSCGKECVVIFFILSAFVIKYTFQSHHHNSLAEFYKVRLIRIYWPFLASLLFSISVLYLCIKYINPEIVTATTREYNIRLSAAHNQLSAMQIIKTIFFIEKGEFAGFNYAYWSLGHELLFYLLFPLYNSLRLKGLLVVALVMAALFFFTGYSIFYYQLFFLAGLAFFEFFFNNSKQALIKNKLLYGFILAAFFIAVNASNKMISEKFSDCVTVIYAFFIFDYIIYYRQHKNTLLMKLGDISYSLYLNHLPLLMLFYTLLSLMTGKLVFFSRLPYYGGVIFALLFTVPIYLFVEKPSLTYLRKLRK